jgi:hypothetical protein
MAFFGLGRDPVDCPRTIDPSSEVQGSSQDSAGHDYLRMSWDPSRLGLRGNVLGFNQTRNVSAADPFRAATVMERMCVRTISLREPLPRFLHHFPHRPDHNIRPVKLDRMPRIVHHHLLPPRGKTSQLSLNVHPNGPLR